ncbi:MAG: DNA polymerase [Bacteroidales bacterium]
MLNRPLYPKQKTVTLICDVPNKIEIENEEPFSSASNLNLLTSLRNGRVNIWNKTPVPNYVGINSLDIFTTYLDYSYFGEGEIDGNFDFGKEICKRKDVTTRQDSLVESDECGGVNGVASLGRFSPTPEVQFFRETDSIFSRYYQIPHQKDCFVSERLYKHIQALLEEIRKTKPKLIILTGKWSLFFLTGSVTLAQTAGNVKDRKPLGGLVKYRSSVMKIHECWGEFEHNPIVVPIYHPVNASGMPDKIPVMELDIQKLAYRYHKIKEHGTSYFTEPNKEYILGTTKEIILSTLGEYKRILDEKPTLLSCDIECFFLSVIDCIGLTLSKDSGICIPFATVNNPNYWSLEDEVEIMVALREVMLHPNALHVGQNYSFDTQFYHFNWLMQIYGEHDTMVLHHILFNYLPKDLAFLASIYCEFYQYWKDEISATELNPETRWLYNIKDVQYTLEVLENLLNILSKEDQKLQDLYVFQQKRLSPVLVSMMNRGVKVDVEEKERLYTFFKGLMVDIEKRINEVLGFEFNQNSTPQKKALFKDFFGITLKVKKKGGNETCDASAMLQYIEEYPMFRPFLTLMLEYASLKVFVNNFLGMKLDDDNRARTQYRISGTATGRLASTKNVRGKGGNLMNIPSKGKIDLRYAVEVLDASEENEDLIADFEVEGTISLPNIKNIFLPDQGKEIADFDLSGADIMIVAADSECKWLMDYFSTPKEKKVYAHIASEFFQRDISDKGKEYKTFKAVFHGLNYKLGVSKLAAMARIHESLATELKEFYFYLCPEVANWHKKIELSVNRKGYVTNIFGRRGWFLNKTDPNLLNKAVAFIPQSSIADVMNNALVTMHEQHRDIDILLQVHDSAVVQYDLNKADRFREIVKQAMMVNIPYNPILTIPSDGKVSTISYGAVQDIVWESSNPVDAREFRIEEKNLIGRVL